MKTSLRALAALSFLVATGAACSLKVPAHFDSTGDGGIDVDVSVDASALLRALFPDLSLDEIAALARSLTIDQLLALKKELEEARAEASKLSADLLSTASDQVKTRSEKLAPLNDGYPTGIEPVGRFATYDAAKGEAAFALTGIFQGKAAFSASGQVAVSCAGQALVPSVECLADGQTVDLVFLLDITGSMSSVIGSVRTSVQRFVDAVVKRGVHGTMSVVTFQDTVGVNIGFQSPNPKNIERSPFFEPVSIDDANAVTALKDFVAHLEANRGSDMPENLTGAIDFARNGVIGVTANGQPNVIGEAATTRRARSRGPRSRASAKPSSCSPTRPSTPTAARRATRA